MADDEPRPPLATSPDIAKSIWALEITPKLRHFLWAIGVAENLRRRNISVNPFCSRCCSEYETSDHVFFTCTYAVSLRRATGIPITHICDPNTTIEDKFRHLFLLAKDQRIEKNLQFLPFSIMWRLWKSRNDMVFNRRILEQQDTLTRAIADTKEWLENLPANANQNAVIPNHGNRRNRWCKPMRGWVKCNYDASHQDGPSPSGLGWIIRDSHGTFLHCGLGKFQGRMTPIEAECTALLWALQSSWGLGYRSVEFEGDNINLCQLVNGNFINLRLQHYIADIKKWRSKFDSVTFSFKHREQNRCADLLAKKAPHWIYEWQLFHLCPSFLCPFVNDDSNSIG